MSSDSAARTIVLPIEVEIASATGKVRAFREAIGRDLGTAATEAQTKLTQVEQAATKAASGTAAAAKETTNLKAEMRGAQPAISGVMQAINLVGVQAPPAIGGITHAVTALLMTGFTPLGLAMAGAGGLIALFAATQKEVRGLEAAFGSTAERIKDVEDRALSARVALQALRAGRPDTGIFGAELELSRLESAAARRQRSGGVLWSGNTLGIVRGIRDEINDQQFYIEQMKELRRIEEGVTSETTRRGIEEKANLDTIRDALAVERERARVAKSVAEQTAAAGADMRLLLSDFNSKGRSLGENSALDAALAGMPLYQGGDVRPTRDAAEADKLLNLSGMSGILANWQDSATGGVIGRKLTFGGETTGGVANVDIAGEERVRAAVQQRIEMERELRSLRTGTSVEVLRIEDQIAEAEKELALDRKIGSAESVANREKELEVLRAQLGIAKELKPSAPTYTDGLNTRLQSGIEGSVQQGLRDALDPERSKDAFENFARSLADVLRERAAAGLADALFGNTKDGTFGKGGLIGDIVSAISGGGGEAPAAAPSIGAGARTREAEQPVYIIQTFDEASADAMAAKVSSSGARVVMAKGMGGGVSRGSIPARRRG